MQFGQNEDGINICFCDPDTFGILNNLKTGFKMNSSASNAGGWESSWMRQEICPQFLELLPTDLQNVIGTITKYTDNVGNGTGSVESNVTATQDKIFLLSYDEADSSEDNFNNDYEINYTKKYFIYSGNNSRIKYDHLNNNNQCGWFLRSPNLNSSAYFCIANYDGTGDLSNANISLGFSPAVVIY